MKKEINTILQDIYSADPDLKKYEKELTRIVKKLIASRPNAKLNAKFRKELRAELMARAMEIKNAKKFQKFDIFSGFKIYYIAGVVAILLVAIISSVILNFKKTQSDAPVADFGLKITKIDSHAFNLAGAGQNFNLAKPSEAAFSADISSVSKSDSVLNSANRETGEWSETDAMIYPYYLKNYKYVYKGEGFTANNSQGEVLRRLRGVQSKLALSNFLNSFNLGLIGLGTFRNLEINSINLLENHDFGYSIYVNFKEGEVSVSENWEKWQSQCLGGDCGWQREWKLEEIPSAEKIIKVATDFISSHNIDLSIYGQPKIQNDYRHYYNKDIEYVNFYAQVIFPLVINNLEVYDESGYVYGLRVNVNVKEMKVSGIHNLNFQTYESSVYELETDVDKILKVAEKGGYHFGFFGEASETVEVELDEPIVVYMKVWNLSDPSKEADELLVPALVFPIRQVPESDFYGRTTVIVPLVKELLEQQNDLPKIMPMPLMEGSAEAIENL